MYQRSSPLANDGGIVATIKRISPQTIVLFRPGVGPNDESPFDTNGSGDGISWGNRYAETCRGVPADYFQLFNEVSFGGNLDDKSPDFRRSYTQNVVRTEIAMLEQAERYGPWYKLSVGNYTAGVPDPLRFGEDLKPLFTRAAQGGHAVCFHWYSMRDKRTLTDGVEWMLGRLMDYFQQWPTLPILIGEMGLFDTPRWIGPAVWYEASGLLRPYQQRGQKVVCMSWTIRGQQDQRWAADDWTAQLGQYEVALKAGHL